VIPCPLVSKIKPCLDRGAIEILESTSTWIRGDRQIIDTTGIKSDVSFSILLISLLVASDY
jgi:hypothetical protein